MNEIATESTEEHGKTDFTAETHDYRDAGDREMQGAIAESTQRKILIEKRSIGAR
jgi:hypothetical protein